MTEVIREYLTALGFKVDDKSFKKFQDVLARTAGGAAKVGAVTLETATAIELMVRRVARQYEDLYYVGQRAGSSISTLKAYEFAASQIGLTTEEARGSIEAFSAALRTNPGLGGMLRGMGIDARDARKAQGEFIDKMRALGERGYFIGAQLAQMYGIGEREFFQMWKNRDEMKSWESDQLRRQQQAGLNADNNTKKFLGFQKAVRLLEDDISILGDRIAADWAEPATKVIHVMDDVVQRLQRANKETDGWIGTIGSLGAALAGAGGLNYLLKRIFGVGLPASGAARLILGSKGMLRGGGAIGMAGMAAYGMKADSESGHHWRSALREMFGIKDEHEPAPWQSGGAWDKSNAHGRVMDFFIAQGWSREQAAGIAANLSHESKFNPRAAGDGGQAYGLAQWHPDRQEEFRKQFGKDIREASFEEQLAFIQHELTKGREQFAGRKLREARTAEEAGASVSRYYERPRDAVGEAERRGQLAKSWLNGQPLGATGGGASVTISQKTDIHVSGAEDPLSTGKSVLLGQNDVNDRLVRNTVGALR